MLLHASLLGMLFLLISWRTRFPNITSSIVFLRKVSRLHYWDVTSLYMQLKNTAREIQVSERERVLPWYK